MIGSLEGLALRLSGPGARGLAAGLDGINERLALSHLSPRQRADLERRWHEMLVSRNPNRELADLLERTRGRLRAYAGSWERSAAEIETARAEHAEIARLVGAGQLDEAAEALLHYWVRSARVVDRWLKSQG